MSDLAAVISVDGLDWLIELVHLAQLVLPTTMHLSLCFLRAGNLPLEMKLWSMSGILVIFLPSSMGLMLLTSMKHLELTQ